MKRISVRRSSIHGKGVFSLQALTAGERVLQYRGLVTSWREAARHYAYREAERHTFLLSDGRVIDGGRGGNSARWLNHACNADCEVVEESGRFFIEVRRRIPRAKNCSSTMCWKYRMYGGNRSMTTAAVAARPRLNSHWCRRLRAATKRHSFRLTDEHSCGRFAALNSQWSANDVKYIAGHCCQQFARLQKADLRSGAAMGDGRTSRIENQPLTLAANPGKRCAVPEYVLQTPVRPAFGRERIYLDAC